MQVFEDVVAEFGDRPAIRWSEHRVTTYRELDEVSNRIARAFLARAVGKRDRVGICLEKSLIAYAAMLASLKIGAAYFVVDPSNPANRTASIIGRCAPTVVVSSSASSPLFGSLALVVDDDAVCPAWADQHDGARLNPAVTIDGSDPAYVMFTSGSTGTPKGVTISHDNLVHFIHWTQEQVGTRPDDVFTNINPLFFDNSVFDVYASLFAGASLVPFTEAILKQPAALVARMAALRCTVYFSVPSMLVYLQTLKLIVPTSFPALRVMLFGGEGYPKPMLRRLHAAVGDRVALLNVYGPTECTCICSAHRVEPADLGDSPGFAPLGRLNPGVSHLIADGEGRAVPDGETGELYLGGPSVGLGYFAEPELSGRAFVQNPTHDQFFDRMYRTGDLVRRDHADGHLHFVGRIDTQIKRQGYRIELGEIEHALAAIAGVDEAAALFLPGGVAGRIVAVVASGAALGAAALRKALSGTLPAYILPDQIIVVARLLKNPNGKIDRPGLAAAVERGDL